MLARKLELSGKWATTVAIERIDSFQKSESQTKYHYFRACMLFAKHTDLTSSYINGRIFGYVYLELR